MKNLTIMIVAEDGRCLDEVSTNDIKTGWNDDIKRLGSKDKPLTDNEALDWLIEEMGERIRGTSTFNK